MATQSAAGDHRVRVLVGDILTEGRGEGDGHLPEQAEIEEETFAQLSLPKDYRNADGEEEHASEAIRSTGCAQRRGNPGWRVCSIAMNITQHTAAKMVS
jgi:hypothetical protein